VTQGDLVKDGMQKNRKNEISLNIAHLGNVCVGIGAFLVEAKIRNVLEQCYIDLNPEIFLTLVAHEKPTAVFFSIIAYDPGAFIRTVMVAEGWKDDWERDCESLWPSLETVTSELSKDLAEVADQVGLPRSLTATYAIGSQHRVCWLNAEWAEHLSERIVRFLKAWHERSRQAEDQRAHDLDALIEEVANDVGFRAIRGRPKKLLFLQKFYGDRIPNHPNGKMGSPAQNCDVVDLNVATVLIKADERVWLESI